jgi:hypothetical protein
LTIHSAHPACRQFKHRSQWRFTFKVSFETFWYCCSVLSRTWFAGRIRLCFRRRKRDWQSCGGGWH